MTVQSIISCLTGQLTILLGTMFEALFLITLIVALYLILTNWREELSSENIKDRERVTWKALVPAYAFFASIAVGLAIFAGLSAIGIFNANVKHLAWLSLASLIPAWTLVFLDLGRPDNVVNLVKSFNVRARIAWNAVLYTLLALLLVWNIIAPSEISGTLLILASITLETNLAMAFGMSTIPGWEGVHLAAEWVFEALALGGALTSLFNPAASWVSVVSLFIVLILNFWEVYFAREREKTLYFEIMRCSVFKAGITSLILALILYFANNVLFVLATLASIYFLKTAWDYVPQLARLREGPYSIIFGYKIEKPSKSEAMLIISAFFLWISAISFGYAFVLG